MKVCILGIGLSSLTLAKMLVNQGIKVDIISDQKLRKYDNTQTLGISKENIKFFNKNIMNIEKILWNINKIEIFCDNLAEEKILNFQDKNNLFSIVRNNDLYEYLLSNLKKNKLVNFKKEAHYKILIKNYKLIFNCSFKSVITKKFFSKKIEKNYDSSAFVTSFKHKKLKNKIATQYFTKKGPLAFLPISETETSVVYSAREKKIDLEHFIKKYNTKYKILKINKIISFDLRSSNLRSYYHDNIIAFGDMLHKIHPLAGQGFNMIIRDIKVMHKLINFKTKLGLELDKSIGFDFDKNSRDKNYLFSKSIDLIYEFFNIESKINNKILSRSVQFFGKNKSLNKFFTTYADNGILI